MWKSTDQSKVIKIEAIRILAIKSLRHEQAKKKNQIENLEIYLSP